MSASSLTSAQLAELRIATEAAIKKAANWQRLALSLAANPDVVLQLVRIAEHCQANHGQGS